MNWPGAGTGARPKGSSRTLEAALHRYHYLGYRSRVGQNLQYWVCDKQARPVGCVVFGAPAWQGAVRDRWIGWGALCLAVAPELSPALKLEGNPTP